ncbi:MAG: hypothetical protein GWO24_09505, partial [Akkermansiaceae bacterium]|nr:hypothetical protein [Akkermansiaceae bacterium]
MKFARTVALTVVLGSGEIPAEHARDGGPDSVSSLLEDAARENENLLDQNLRARWDEWKGGVAESTGLSFGIDYSAQVFAATDSLAGSDDSEAAGMFRFFGRWDLLNRGESNGGSLNWKVEHRHRYTDGTPSGFSLGNLGNVGVMGGPFN